MSRNDDRSYHEARAKAELERADEATDPAVEAVHRELAALHRRKILEIIDIPRAEEPTMIPGVSPKRAN